MNKIFIFAKTLLGIPVTRYFLSIDDVQKEVYLKNIPSNIKIDENYYSVDSVLHEVISNKVIFVRIFLIKMDKV